MCEQINAHQTQKSVQSGWEKGTLGFRSLVSGGPRGPEGGRSAFLARGSALSTWRTLTPPALRGLQMNGTRPGTGSTRLGPWDKSSQSAHRVDLSTV